MGNYKTGQGILYLIGIIIYGLYILFKIYPVLSIILILLFVLYIYKKYINYRNSPVYIDCYGYERDKLDKRLIHRKVAYERLYNSTKYKERFGYYVVHHIDMNKRNNSPENLQILTNEEHEKIHGF